MRSVATSTPHFSPKAPIASAAPSEPAAAFASVLPARSVPSVRGRSARSRSRRAAPGRPAVLRRKTAASFSEVMAVSAAEKNADAAAQRT